MDYIRFENVEKNYGGQQVLHKLNLTIKQGDFVTLLGPSGCGKSTILRCLAGLEPLSGGEIFLDGENITHKNAKERNVGMIFQQYSLFPTMNIYQNISFGLRMKRMDKEEIRQAVRDALKMVNLEGSEKKYPSQMSGGEQQRVALARCLVTKPKVLLLDEPFSAIDAKLRKALQIRIKEIHEELAMTSIFVTHDQEEAMTMSDLIHLMNLGKIEQSGTPTELYANPKTDFAAGFMGSYNLLSSEIFGKNAAIRPELIGISREAFPDTKEAYLFSGVVTARIPQGNIQRYHVLTTQTEWKVDVIFDGHTLFEKGEAVNLRINSRDILIYD